MLPWLDSAESVQVSSAFSKPRRVRRIEGGLPDFAMRNEIATLQDLRGIAILIVVGFHVGQLFDYHATNNGTTGVLLFFSISGFIIARIHEKDAGILRLVVFAKKRIARIYPPYLPVFLLFLVFLLIAGAGSDYHRNIGNVIENMLLIQNTDYSIHPYAWSLAYEVFYYFIFGVLVIILRIPIRGFCMIVCIPSLLAICGILSTNHTRLVLLLSTFNLYFAFGAAYSTWKYRSRLNDNRALSWLFLIGVMAYPMLPQYELIRYLLMVGLFISYMECAHSNRWLHATGNCSFSIYLTHALVLPVIKKINAPQNIFVFLLVIILCIFVGSLYHYFVEMRLVRKIGSILGVRYS